MSFESKVKDIYQKMQDKHLQDAGFKTVITIEKSNGKKFTLSTLGKKGRVLIDEFDRNKIYKFVGKKNYNIALGNAIESGKNYSTANLRVSYEFIVPKTTNKNTFSLDSIQRGLDAVLGPPKHKRIVRSSGRKRSNSQGLNKVR
jgi:hypothetical protein